MVLTRGVVLQAHSTVAVSYTHLDVYKRQVLYVLNGINGFCFYVCINQSIKLFYDRITGLLVRKHEPVVLKLCACLVLRWMKYQ